MEHQTIEKLLALLCQEIGGDWLLAGGSLIQLEVNDARATEDIDLVNILAFATQLRSGDERIVRSREKYRFNSRVS